MAVIFSGIDIKPLPLVFLGLATGVISGFVGVDGGVIVAPALIILGIPAHYAVGTSMLWVMGNAVFGTIRHRQEGNVDFKLTLASMILVAISGSALKLVGAAVVNPSASRGGDAGGNLRRPWFYRFANCWSPGPTYPLPPARLFRQSSPLFV